MIRILASANVLIDAHAPQDTFGMTTLFVDASALRLKLAVPPSISMKIAALVSAGLLLAFQVMLKIRILALVFVLKKKANRASVRRPAVTKKRARRAMKARARRISRSIAQRAAKKNTAPRDAPKNHDDQIHPYIHKYGK